jgi:hypothetical protein
MLAQEMALLDAFEINPAPAAPGKRRGPAEAMPSAVSATIAEGDDAVVLLEQDGLYVWRFPSEPAADRAPARRRARVTGGPRRLTFDLRFPATATAEQRRRRGPIADFVLDKVRAYVFRFVARVASTAAIGYLERHVQPGLVVMNGDDPTLWRRIERLNELTLPTDRGAKILLFVHGTFSSTVGGFGPLTATEWGRAFLDAARHAYDAVIGFDHPTLSMTPRDNANDLLARLEAASLPVAPEIHAVAHSRGALTLRSFIEHVLPISPLKDWRVRRAIFVGGTNGGTELASPDKIESFVDLWTNLAVGGSRALDALGTPIAGTILRETLKSLGALVKYLAAAALGDRAIPGLAAMVPKGTFVKDINTLQPGQPSVAESFYCIVTSDFDVALLAKGQGPKELPARLGAWAADALVDGLMAEANDMVVHVRGMGEIDPDVGAFVKDRLDFGKNPHVYHTAYFTRPETVRALSVWLGLDPLAPAAIESARSHGIALVAPLRVFSSRDRFGDVVTAIEQAHPAYVIIERADYTPPLPYAYRADEVLALAERLRAAGDRALAVDDALRTDADLAMHEDGDSPVVPVARPTEGPTHNHRTGQRRILRDDRGAYVGVHESGSALPSTEDLVAAERRTRSLRRTRMTRSARPRNGGGDAPRATPLPETSAPPVPPEDAAAAAPAMPRAANGGGTAAARAPADAKLKLFTTAKMPGEVAPDDEVDVEVALSRREISVAAGPTAAAGSVAVDEATSLLVRVVAKTGFDVVGAKSVELDPRKQDRFDLTFTVRATTLGEGEVIVQIQQGGFVLERLTLRPVVRARARKTAPAVAAAADIPAAGLCDMQFPMLTIQERGDKDRPRLEFALFNGRRYYLAESAPMKMSVADRVEAIYERVEEFWVESKQQVVRFEELLAEYGAELFDELIPREIQQPLWDARDILTAIQVLSEEPYIPWEMVHLREPGRKLSKEQHFLATKGLVRWVFNAPDAPCELTVRAGHGFYTVPDYPHPDYELPEARKEVTYLEGTLKAQPLDLPSSQLIAALGERDTVDFYHFAGHGDADVKRAAEDARVMLKGEVIGGQYHAEYLEERQVRTRLDFMAGGTRPVVTLNACRAGRASWNLTKVGGFAKSFVDGGAGAFVGALWEVGDGHARRFTEAFYEGLRSNQTLSVAATNARLKARESGESTWLAYVVYGYPHATVRFE